ncbi:MAG: hypothetical protein ICV60_10615 [Pyrinomonadaceae bacterium]|nr:hypothetical protein [Pyrinomonadaceae bacterium]
MSTEIWTTIITAAATIIAPSLSAYVSYLTKKKSYKRDTEQQRRLREGKQEQAPPPRPSYKTEIAIVSIAFLIALGILVFGLRASQPSNYESFIMKAREAKRPYVIEAATMVIEIENVKAPKVNDLKVSRHITYTLRALKDIPRTPPVFDERYDTELAKEVVPWTGTEDEQAHSSGGSEYSIVMEIKKDDLKTFTTGVDTTYALPLAERPAFYGQVHLRGNQDYASYVNDEDYICNLTIIIRSRKLPLTPASDNPAVTMTLNNPIEYSGVKYSFPTNANGWYTLSKSWSYIAPQHAVGILFQWP